MVTVPAPQAKGLLAKRIPTLIGLGLLMVGVVVGIVLVGRGTGGFLPRAAEGATPKQVRITNITDTGFAVSFITDTVSPGYIRHGTDADRATNQVADDRDQLTGGGGEYTTHHVTVRGLLPGTQYYFQIGTGSRDLFDNNGEPFAVRTARALTTAPEARTAYGNIRNEVGNPADGALVYLSVPGASPLSALVKANGSWAVPISGWRTADLSAAFSLTDDLSVRIQVLGAGRGQTLEASALVKDLSPLVDLQFGQTPPSPGADTELSASPTPTPASALGDTFSESEGTQVNEATPVGVSSVQEGETISTERPEFSGQAPPNSYLQIEVHSPQTYAGVAQTDSTGSWSWTPPGNLEPGQHTIVVTYTDPAGIQQKVERNFIVQASTGFPAFTATPSGATPIPTPLPTPLPTPEPTPLPTPEPTPIAVIGPTPEPQPQPVSGAINPFLTLAGLALLFFSSGVWGARLLYGRRR